MLNSPLKCAECTRLGKPCVDLTWGGLDKTTEEYQKRVDDDEKLLAEVILRILRNKKILKQANQRADRKALCLASDMKVEGENANAEGLNCPAASIGMALSPVLWRTLDFIDISVAEHGVAQPQVPKGSS